MALTRLLARKLYIPVIVAGGILDKAEIAGATAFLSKQGVATVTAAI